MPTGQVLPSPFANRMATQAIAYSPDARVVAAGSVDGSVWLFSAAGPHLDATIETLPSAVTDVAFSPDGRLVAAGSTDGTVRLWQLEGHEPIASFAAPSAVVGIAFSPDGTAVGAGCEDGTVVLWDVATQTTRSETSMTAAGTVAGVALTLTDEQLPPVVWTGPFICGRLR